MSETQDIKRTTEIVIPLEEVQAATDKVVNSLQQKVRLQGFRPGKAPLSIIRSRFKEDIRQEVVEKLVPQAFRARADQEDWKVVGNPNVTDIHFHDDEPIRFKAEFEVLPEFTLGEYRGLQVPYDEPVVTDEDIAKRLEGIRDQKADYVNIDPRPIEDGDYAVVSLKSIAGVEGDPVEQPEVMLHVGGEETIPAYTEALRGMTPPDGEADVEVTYPEEYAAERLAGKTVKFHMVLKGLRKKELPELNDDFAQDIGDFKTLDELKEEIRKTILRERENQAQTAAKNKLVDQLVDTHEFPVPEAFVDQQIQANVESRLYELAGAGVDVKKLNLKWDEIRASQKDRATREVRASMLLDKIAEREAIEVLNDEIDREIHTIARRERQPAAAVRKQLEENGAIRRIAMQIRTSKVLNFLFEQSKKVAGELPAAEPPAAE
ncbi:MAG TPA: trigger factor [Bryobacteraceae bacterium]|nr:trigger factor [Bryobacteraceae bacterium]